MCIIEHILQECEFLTWNNLNTESIFHLPLPFQGNESLIDKEGRIVKLTRLYNPEEFASLVKEIDGMLSE